MRKLHKPCQACFNIGGTVVLSACCMATEQLPVGLFALESKLTQLGNTIKEKKIYFLTQFSSPEDSGLPHRRKSSLSSHSLRIFFTQLPAATLQNQPH
jgi:hypothetical protein